MIFADLPAGSAVFVDANTFVYHFAPDPILAPACTDLLVRIKKQEIEGLTSTHVLSEVAHRLMTIEAIASLGWDRAKTAETSRGIDEIDALSNGASRNTAVRRACSDDWPRPHRRGVRRQPANGSAQQRRAHRGCDATQRVGQ